MHSATQIWAQRAPPATRTKARWQPYNSIPSSTSSLPSRSPTATYLNTPASTVSSSPAPAPSLSEFCRLRQTLSSSASTTITTATSTQTPKDLPLRDFSKNKFAAGLVDQAVKTLSEIWRPQDIPNVYSGPQKTPIVGLGSSNSLRQSQQQQQQQSQQHQQLNHRTQLPSAVPLSTQIVSPLSSTSTSSTCSQPSTTTQVLLLSGNDQNATLMPIRSFMQEVLRRSRTTGSVLQTALCYLEAIRLKIPELLQEENSGIKAHHEPESRILAATPAELEREAELCELESAAEYQISDDILKTVRVLDHSPDGLDYAQQSGASGIFSGIDLNAESSTSTCLPSPLLCPRRAFLASLILASKFSQDKCYSNRAWAKLVGLPPRELGRCERALGQALEWRLWVGKTTLTAQDPVAAAAAATPLRTVVRSQSEASIITPPAMRSQFCSQEHQMQQAYSHQVVASSHSSGFRRSATLPAEAFTRLVPAGAASDDMACESGDYDMPSPRPDADQQLLTVIGSISEQRLEIQPSSAFTPQSCSAQVSSELQLTRSPSPETPTLSYSPSSTEYSAGSRTIQMATFDDNTFSSHSYHSQLTRPWTDVGDSRSHITRIVSPPVSRKAKCNKGLYLGGAYSDSVYVRSRGVTVADPEAGPFDTPGHCLWHEGNHCMSLDVVGVH
ncbi:hypothetical protein B0H34DRAFT_795687 [Crassisporium funariophilum]|nr:hypothetical protein B0H34DRAFT_795687 [Crassisporium funariophilum]